MIRVTCYGNSEVGINGGLVSQVSSKSWFGYMSRGSLGGSFEGLGRVPHGAPQAINLIHDS